MKRPILAMFAIALAANFAIATEFITIGERVTIESKIMGEQRTLLISLPGNYALNQDSHPVLYMTDGSVHLTSMRGTVDILVRNGLMPDVIIVGVANTNRTRDLTPTHAFRVREDGTREEIANSGGSGKFLEFFAQEAIPYIEQHYRTQPYRIFAGHSYGGLFALTVLVSRPDLFQAYIVASPSLDFDADYPLRSLETFFKGRKELQRTLFVTMANEETGDPAPTHFDRLQQLLGSVKAAGFEWSAKLMPEETHGTVVLNSHYWGLRRIFAAWPLPVGPDGRFLGGIKDVKKHFAGVSLRLGFSVVPPEDTVNAVGYGAFFNNDIEGAIALFKYNVELHPLSTNVYDSLGEVLERAGRLEEALLSYAKAVENATLNNDARLALFTANRDRTAAALAKQMKSQ